MNPNPATPAPALVHLACLNCGEPLLPRAGGQPALHCPACGQETHVRPPKLGEFLQQFGGAYFATEGALWRTLKLLLLKPGELTAQYLAGRRKHYVLPLRLYLSVSLVVLLLFRISATASLEAPGLVRMDGTEPRNGSISLGPGRAGMKDGVFFCEQLPGWLCQRIQRRIDVKPEALEGMVRQVSERFVANLGASMFVLLPAFALWLKLAYRGRGLRYTEHLVFALHVHTAWFLVFGLLLLPWGWLNLLWLAVPVYTLMAMKRVYGGRWWARWLRAGLVATLYLLTLGLATSLLGLWAFLG